MVKAIVVQKHPENAKQPSKDQWYSAWLAKLVRIRWYREVIRRINY